MFEKSAFEMTPVAQKGSQIVSGNSRMTILTDGLVRLENTTDGQFEDRASTFAINRDLPTPKFDLVKRDNGSMEIVTDRLFIQWTGEAFGPNSLLVTLRKKGDGNTGWSNVWRYGDDSNHHWSNLGGTFRTLDNVNGRCKLDDGVLSQYGLSLLDDSTSMLFTDDGWIAGRGKDKTDVYLFGYGLKYRDALKTFFTVSGRPPLVPRWSLGNWWSRYYAYSGEEYLGLMDRFRKEGMPLSVAVVDIDWHLMDVPEEFGTAWTGYTWNEKLFPDHVKFLKGLHDRQLKSSLNTHPADGVRAFEKAYKDMCKALGRDSSKGVPIPFECADKQFFTEYFKQLHHPIEDEGVDFWWLDWQQGPNSEVAGVDPLWVLNHYHFIDSGRKGDRRFTFSRYAGPGSHRYPIGFSGDTHMTWDSLAFQPEFTATASNIGYSQWSHDIGGHMFGYKDDELMARWVQYGCFSPFLRLHSSESPFNTREPWAFSSECYDVCAKFLQFRHRLVPYLYSANVVTAQTFKALVEPLYYDYPERAEAYQYRNQYSFGSELLVIPVVERSSDITKLAKTTGWLPPGKWVDIFDDALVYEGDQIMTFHRALDEYPVLAKEGAIIPLDGKTGSDLPNGCPTPDSLEILLVVGQDGQYDLYEDDGSGEEFANVQLSTTPFRYTQAKGTLTIGPTSNPLLKKRSYTVRLLASSAVNAKATAEGSKLEASIEGDRVINLGVVSTSATITIDINNGSAPSLVSGDNQAHMFDRLRRAHTEILAKERVWNAVKQLDVGPVHKVMSQLNAIEADEEIKKVVLEIVLANPGKV